MVKRKKILIFAFIAVVIFSIALFFAIDWNDLRIKKEIRRSAQESPSAPFLKDIAPLKDWYSHRISGNILLTRQEELPDIGATEIYAYGEQIGIHLIKNELSPEEWAAQKAYIDLDDVLVSSKEWSTYHGQKLLTVEHEAAGAGRKMLTKYLFAGDLIYIISLYPLETYDDESGVYVRNDEGVRDLSRVMYRLLPQILSQESVRQELAENCARDISQRVDDASFDQENKIVMTWLWDEESQDNIAIILLLLFFLA